LTSSLEEEVADGTFIIKIHAWISARFNRNWTSETEQNINDAGYAWHFKIIFIL